jgi:hypothetical protein
MQYGAADAAAANVASAAGTGVSSTSVFDVIMQAFATCRSTGTGGTLSMWGFALFPPGLIAAGNLTFPSAGATVVSTIDTTVGTNGLSFQALRGTAAGDTVVATDIILEAMNYRLVAAAGRRSRSGGARSAACRSSPSRPAIRYSRRPAATVTSMKKIRLAEGGRMDIPLQTRLAPVGTVDTKARTAELVWSRGARVQRYDWWNDETYFEELSMDPAHVRLGACRAGAPLLDTHNRWEISGVLGVVENATVANGEGRATVRFSERDEVSPSSTTSRPESSATSRSATSSTSTSSRARRRRARHARGGLGALRNFPGSSRSGCRRGGPFRVSSSNSSAPSPAKSSTRRSPPPQERIPA